MSFVSDDFIYFFVAVTVSFFALPQRFRWVLVLGASLFFYAYWRIDYLFLFAVVVSVNYVLALQIARTPGHYAGRRKLLLAVSMAASLGMLFIFKYYNFFTSSINDFLLQLGMTEQLTTLNVLLPVGISFYTFQAMAYTIDVYRGTIPAERHFGIFWTFIAFFPQLVAGPIERASHLLPQFRQPHPFDYERTISGLRLILWGAFKKIVIADRLAVYVNTVYNNVEAFSGLYLILATLFFGIQIYCDFSGYSDIAIGTARVLGFDLMQNFRQPYFSRSIREFWRRWHISLSTWFRDYVYIPLGGNRVSVPRNYVNLLIVFVASGLWHGANWTFLIWGTLHGVYIVAEDFVERRRGRRVEAARRRFSSGLSMLLTFSLVTFAWIFFRSNSLPDAIYIVTHLFDFSSFASLDVSSLAAPFDVIAPLSIGVIDLVMALFTISILIVVDGLATWTSSTQRAISLPNPWRWAAYYAAVFLVVYSVSTSQPAFIYFQF